MIVLVNFRQCGKGPDQPTQHQQQPTTPTTEHLAPGNASDNIDTTNNTKLSTAYYQTQTARRANSTRTMHDIDSGTTTTAQQPHIGSLTQIRALNTASSHHAATTATASIRTWHCPSTPLTSPAQSARTDTASDRTRVTCR